MSTFTCPAVRVAEVIDHPGADRLSIVRLEGLGYTCISGKLEDGSPRYQAGDYVVYIPSAAVLPEWLLKEMDFWNTETGKGTLAGANGARVKPLRLRGIFSEGVLFPVTFVADEDGHDGDYWLKGQHEDHVLPSHHVNGVFGPSGVDVADILGITKWEPPVPVAMAGEVANLFGHTVLFNFERIESVPDMFEPGEPVVASEKLHGTFASIVFEPGLNHPEMFGSQGEIIVHSKGLGAQGLAFKNNEANANNLYVRTLRALLDSGFEDRIRTMSWEYGGKSIAVLGEIFGRGVQDLAYGVDKPAFRMFDVKVADQYLTQIKLRIECAHNLGIDLVPTVYEGPFDLAALEAVRDGRTMLGGANIREGIVVRSATEARHEIHGRRIAKFISPDYLTRKSKDATEYT
ncbi:RNA_lig_DRB0094, RNA ligase [uncultured Caudovirales phage]|uniref:RNA_lig_DRB0094, RNA ligase n=1 Tax=uncultured Caudovirales phage TaxID=2100421 RepID=A0A6J5KMZ9_9CAUD|nr:RNA_lig_DRB0094, RNA ligase [uncultured Caudovirales phage]